MFRYAIFRCILLAPAACCVAAKKRPNVLLIMADDQDKLLNSLDPAVMPNLHEYLINQGVNYDKHYCTVAWCCPSRVNFFTGRAAHNTNVTGLAPPYGGWPKFSEQGLNDNYLPVWLQSAGIKTYYAGKLMNSFTVKNFDIPAWPKGWDDASFLVDPWTYNYWHSHWVSQAEKKVESHGGTHTTLVLQEEALDMLDRAIRADEQFFMMLAPVAPHIQIGGGSSVPPAPPMFRGKFSDYEAPRTPNFNPDKPSGASWIKAKPKLTPHQVAYGDKVHRHRLQNIAGVDHLLGLLIKKLEQHNILDNTYVIYTSDNGFHISNHRLKPGKRCGFEEDINIPLVVRGPNVPKGVTTDAMSSHTDFAPTLLRMLGIEHHRHNNDSKYAFDGRPFPYTHHDLHHWNHSEHVGIEFWDGNHYGPDGKVLKAFLSGVGDEMYYFNGTYKGLRLRTKSGESWFYNVWCTGERELYDMNADQYQMNNLLAPAMDDAGTTHNEIDRISASRGTNATQLYFGRHQSALVERLDAMLMILKTCTGDSCRDPWSVLFPKGHVRDVKEAMHEHYDEFFAAQPKVRFSQCIGGEVRAFTGPQNVNVFGTHKFE